MGKYKRKGPTNQTTHIQRKTTADYKWPNNYTIYLKQDGYYMRASAPRKVNNIEFTDRSSYSRLESYST